MTGARIARLGSQDVAQPDARPPPRSATGLPPRELEPGLVLAQVVEQEPRLALERDEAGQPLELAGVEPAVGDGDPEADRLAARGRLEADLVDREAEVVEPADPGADRVPVVGRQLRFDVELVPQRGVARRGPISAASTASSNASVAALHRAEVGQPEADVLDQDVEVERALAVRQRGMDLARLGVDEVGLDLVAVAPEQGVRERAVAPEHAGPVEVDQQRRHRVEQPVAIRPRPEREAHQQAPVLDRVGQVFGRRGWPRRRRRDRPGRPR